MDLMFGLVVYAVTAWAFGRAFDPVELGVVLFFAMAPDFDWAPYLLLKRRLKLYSHWLIHYPLAYIWVGILLIWIVTLSGFWMTSFVLASLAHFLHDSHSVPGIQWLWPLTDTAWALHRWRMVRVDPEERHQFYDRLRQGASQRGVWQEIKMRIGKFRPEWFSRRE